MREREGPWASLAFSFSFCRQKINAYVWRLKFEFCYFLLNARYLLHSFSILWTHHHHSTKMMAWKSNMLGCGFQQKRSSICETKGFFYPNANSEGGDGKLRYKVVPPWCTTMVVPPHHSGCATTPQWLCHHGAPQGGCWQLLWQYSRHSLALASWFLFKLVRITAALGFSWTIMFFSCVWFLLQGDDGEDIYSEASNVATWWGHPCYGLLLWDV